VLALVATLPGAIVLVAARRRARDGAIDLTKAQRERLAGVANA
jgi:hypothetical protein